jgi:phosphopantothenoylcysteine decarboxylase/phosphopantothenoylcysteine decarboxylase/phosphopantothenate--cysteine ligase
MAKILLGVTGSISVYKAADLANILTKSGHSVKTIMTKAALEFVRPLTFETLTKNPVHTKTFKKNGGHDIEHISLTKEADLFLVAPASANIIAKFAAGIADDLLSTSLLAFTGKPIVLCPAMNTAMFENPITQRNIETLKSLGVNFVPPRVSKLACGDTGKGAMETPEEIMKKVNMIL